MKNKSILITGSTGLIGNHILIQLKDKGFKKIYAVSKSKQEKHENPNLVQIRCDLLKRNDFRKLPKKINYLIHTAAITPTSKSQNKDYKQNLIISQNIIKYCCEFKIENLIMISSGSVYGNNIKKKFNEKDFCYPKSEYAINHYMSEQLFKKELLKTKVTILRLFYPYGFYFDNFSRSLMNKIIDKLKKDLTIDIPKHNKITPLFIDDLSEIICFFIKENITGLFNIAGPNELLFEEYLGEISKSMNITLKTKENRAIESPISPDVSKLKSLIKKNLLTDYRTGLKEAILRRNL